MASTVLLDPLLLSAAVLRYCNREWNEQGGWIRVCPFCLYFVMSTAATEDSF